MFSVWVTNWMYQGSKYGSNQEPWTFTFAAGVLTNISSPSVDITVTGTGPWTITDNRTRFVWNLPIVAGRPNPAGITRTAGVSIPRRVIITFTSGIVTCTLELKRETVGGFSVGTQAFYQWGSNNGFSPATATLGNDGTQYDLSINLGGPLIHFKANATDTYGSVDTTAANWTQTAGAATTLSSVTTADDFTSTLDHYFFYNLFVESCLPLTGCCIVSAATAAVTIDAIGTPRDFPDASKGFPADTGYTTPNDIRTAALELIDEVTLNVGLPYTLSKSGSSICQWLADGTRILPPGSGSLFPDGVDRGGNNAGIYYVQDSQSVGVLTQGVWQADWLVVKETGPGDGTHPDIQAFAFSTINVQSAGSGAVQNYEHLGRPYDRDGGSASAIECNVYASNWAFNVGTGMYEEVGSGYQATVEVDVTWTVTGNTKHVNDAGDCVDD